MPLRIVGVDNPGGGLQQQVAPVQKNIGVADVTDQALQNAQKAQQQTSELVKGQVEIQAQSARQKQTEASTENSGDVLYNTVRVAGELFKQFTKIENDRTKQQQEYNEEAKEERQKFNLANASQELRDSMIDARNVFDTLGREKGTEAVRKRFTEVMLKYNDLSPEAHKELTTYFYSALDDIDREQWNEAQRNRRELSDAKVAQVTFDLKQRQATRLAELREGPQRDNPEFTRQVMADIVSDADRAAKEMGFNELQSTQFKGNVLRLIAENAEEAAQTRAEAAARLKDLQEFQVKAAAIESADLPPDVKKNMLDAARLQHGQNGSTDPMTAIDVMKTRVEIKGLERQLKQFEVEGILEKGEASGLSKFALTDMALSYIENPSEKFKLEALKTVQPLQYAEVKNQIDYIETLLKNVRSAQPKLASLSTRMSKLKGRVEEINGLKTMGAEGLTALKKAGQSVDYTDEAAVVAELQGLQQEYNVLVGPASQDLQQLANMGVLVGANGQYTRDPASMAKLDAARQAVANQPPRPTNFNQGGAASQATALKPSSDLHRMSVNGKQLATPFLPKDGGKSAITSGYGMREHPVHGGMKMHSGVDFSGYEGQPIAAVRSGKVVRSELNGSLTSGFGYYVEVEHADGTATGYAHLHAPPKVKVGQVIPQGFVVGGMGTTGSSTGVHLHFASYTKAHTGTATDPIAYLAKHGGRESGQVAARGMGLPPQQSPNTSNSGIYRQDPVAQFTLAQERAPAGSLPLATGGYIFNGQVHLPAKQYEQMAKYTNNYVGRPLTGGQGGSVVTPKQFNSKLPMVGTRASANLADYGKTIVNDPAANYGYASLTEDKDFSRALAATANRLGFPAVWLADIMAFESTYEGKTHNPRAINGDGAVGLIQFYPGGGLAEVAQAMGTNESVASARLRNMTPAQQMRWVEFYLKNRIQEVGKFKRMDDLFASIFGGTGLVRTPDNKRGGDGQISYFNYLDNIGHHVGRKYHHGLMRGSDKPRTHTNYVNGCAMCASMQNDGRFVTHKHTVPNTSSTRSSNSPLLKVQTGKPNKSSQPPSR